MNKLRLLLFLIACILCSSTAYAQAPTRSCRTGEVALYNNAWWQCTSTNTWSSISIDNPTLAAGVPTGTAFPSTCSVGSVIVRTDQPAGSNLFVCGTSNNWVSATGTGSGTVTGVSFGTVPSWLTTSVANSSTTPTLTVSAATGQTSHKVLGTGAGTSFGPISLTTSDLPSLSSSSLTDSATLLKTSNIPASGVVKSTGTAFADAASSDIISLFGSGACSGYLKSDGTCSTPSGGSGTVTNFSVTSVPSWLSSSVANATTTPALTLSAAGTQTSHQVIGTCGTGTSFGPCSLVVGDLPNGYLYSNLSGAPSLFNQTVENGGTPVTQRAKLNFAAGSNVTITPTDNGTDTTTFTIASTGGSGTVTLSGDTTGSGTGTITTTTSKVNGTSVPVNSAADQAIVTTAAATGSWASLPSCLDSGGQHLNYNTTTHSFSCGTTGGTAGSAAFNTITGGTNTQAAMVVGTGASLAPSGSGTITANALSSVASTSLSDTANLVRNNQTNTYTNQAAPATPAAGTTSVYVDSTNKVLAAKNDAGTVSSTVVPSTAASHQFATGVGANGAISYAQPAFTDISGSVVSTQLPNPSASTLGGVESLSAASHKWISSISTSGVPSATQPASTDLSDIANLDTNTQNYTAGAFTYDFSGAAHSLPAKKGLAASRPATCTQGEEYFATDAVAGQNMYYCTAANTWTQQLNSGGGMTPSGTITTGALVTAASATSLQTPSATATMDSSGNISVPGKITAAGFTSSATTPGEDVLVAGTGNIAALPANSAGFAAPASGGTSYLLKMPGTATAGLLFAASPATGDGVNESALSFGNFTGDASNAGTTMTVAKVNGTSIPANTASDQTVVTTASATGSWASLPNCQDTGGNHLNYNTTTHAYSCGTSGGAGGGVSSFTGDGTLLSNSASTGAVTATLASAAAHTVLGNTGATSAAPAYTANPSVSSVVLNGSTSGTATLSVSATGGTLNLGSTSATVSSTGALTVASCTGCGSGSTETASASLAWFPWGTPSYTVNGGTVAPTANTGTVQAFYVQSPIAISYVAFKVAASSGTSCTGGTCGAQIGIYSADLTTQYCITSVGTSGNATANLNINAAAASILYFPMSSGSNVSGGVCTLSAYPAMYKLVLTTDSTALALQAYGDGASSTMMAFNSHLSNAGQSTSVMSTGDGASLSLSSNLSSATLVGLSNIFLFSFQR